MLTYLLRHARTAYSATYRVNGDTGRPVHLDSIGQEQCHWARVELPTPRISTCIVSGFSRARETANLLLAGRTVPLLTDQRLNEIDYGHFEDGPFLEYGRWLDTYGPWTRPPGSRESQREAILRMTDGLRDALAWHGPRIVVAHGLLLSVVQHVRNGEPIAGDFFPEAPYVVPLALTDDELRELTSRLIEQIRRERHGQVARGRARVSPPVKPLTLATFGHGSVSFGAEPRNAAEPHREEDRYA